MSRGAAGPEMGVGARRGEGWKGKTVEGEKSERVDGGKGEKGRSREG